MDNNFLSISEKMNVLNFRQVYRLEYQKYKLGDLTIKIGSLFRDVLSKSIFFEIYNPYNNKYEEIKDFSYEVVQTLFDNNNSSNNINIANFCLFDSTLEKLYKEDKLKPNSHWEFIQYVHFIFKKH